MSVSACTGSLPGCCDHCHHHDCSNNQFIEQNVRWKQLTAVTLSFVLYAQRFMHVVQVAETMFNPYGEDDDDYEMNMFIDQYMKV